MKFRIESTSKEPIYKQLVIQVERALHDGQIQAGEQIPSMNELATQLNISKETVKKAYGILVEKSLIVPKHGKGFYAADLQSSGRPQILVIFDKFSVYKQIMFNAFAETLTMGTNAAFPPYEYYEEGTIVGIDAEIAAAICAKLGCDLEIMDMDFKRSGT